MTISLNTFLLFFASVWLGADAIAVAGGEDGLSARDGNTQGFNYSRIHPNGDNDLCLTVADGKLEALGRVQISKCFGDGNPYQAVETWAIPSFGDGVEIKLSQNQNESLCLINEESHDSLSGLMIGVCRDAPPRWTVPESELTTIRNVVPAEHYPEGYTFCLDAKQESQPKPGDPYGSEKDVQMYSCYEGNTNQLWSFEVIDRPAEWNATARNNTTEKAQGQ